MTPQCVHNIHQDTLQYTVKRLCNEERVCHLPNHLLLDVFLQLNALFSQAATANAIAARSTFRWDPTDRCRSGHEDVLELKAMLWGIEFSKLRVTCGTSSG